MPASVRGPVECSELARLMAARREAHRRTGSVSVVACMLIPLGTGIARLGSVRRGRVGEVVEREGKFGFEWGVTEI